MWGRSEGKDLRKMQSVEIFFSSSLSQHICTLILHKVSSIFTVNSSSCASTDLSCSLTFPLFSSHLLVRETPHLSLSPALLNPQKPCLLTSHLPSELITLVPSNVCSPSPQIRSRMIYSPAHSDMFLSSIVNRSPRTLGKTC